MANPGWAQDRDKLIDRVSAASTLLDENMAAPESRIPVEILGSAECEADVPSMLKGGVIVG
ncbi:MAG: hypothetical protein AB7O65_09160 [Candidatus Korobacteraceae bacterium]